MNKGADRKRGLVRITRQVHVDLDVFFIQARVLLVDRMLGPCRPDVISAVGGEHVGTSFSRALPQEAPRRSQEAPGGAQEVQASPRRLPRELIANVVFQE